VKCNSALPCCPVFCAEGPLKQLERKMDFIHIGLFLHLFDLEGQVEAYERIVSLIKPEKGSLILGQQIGSLERGPLTEERKMYKHNVESFDNKGKEARQRTGSKWKINANIDAGLSIDQNKRALDDAEPR
jgi:hypothetical protein